MSEDTIRTLPIWKNDVGIELLSGGLTNVNYRVTDGDASFAVRLVDDDPDLGISRNSEVACARAAAELGIAPRVAHAAPGVLVCEFVEGCVTLSPERLADHDTLRRAARSIRAIHDAGPVVAGHMMYFSPFQVTRTYARFAAERGLHLPEPADGLLATIQRLQAAVPPAPATFCHNDMMPGNFLEAAGRLWVIDWEYAGIGAYPLFDLAGLSSNCGFDEELDTVLLEAYAGAGAAPDRGPFLILKTMAALRESLWGVVQGNQATIDFDYDGYRDENHARYVAYRDAALQLPALGGGTGGG